MALGQGSSFFSIRDKNKLLSFQIFHSDHLDRGWIFLIFSPFLLQSDYFRKSGTITYGFFFNTDIKFGFE